MVHFLALGAGLYFLSIVVAEEESGNAADSSDSTIRISSEQVAAIRERVHSGQITGSTPDMVDQEVQALVREEVLLREAMRNGLAEDDLIIRRRLIQKMEQLIDALSEPEPPSEEELQRWYREHQDEYRTEARVSFRHVFFRRGRSDVSELASDALGQLRSGAVDPAEAGDPFVLSNALQRQRPAQLIRTFGQEATDLLFTLAPGEWNGPIASHLGLHLVLVTEQIPSRVPSYEDVQAAVETDLMYARKAEEAGALYESLAAQYEVEIGSESIGSSPLAWLDR